MEEIIENIERELSRVRSIYTVERSIKVRNIKRLERQVVELNKANSLLKQEPAATIGNLNREIDRLNEKVERLNHQVNQIEQKFMDNPEWVMKEAF